MSGMVHRARFDGDGNLSIPAELRRELAVGDDGEVRMEVVNGELRVRSARIDWEKIRANVRKYVPEGVSLVDELIAERRAEAARE